MRYGNMEVPHYAIMHYTPSCLSNKAPLAMRKLRINLFQSEVSFKIGRYMRRIKNIIVGQPVLYFWEQSFKFRIPGF